MSLDLIELARSRMEGPDHGNPRRTARPTPCPPAARETGRGPAAAVAARGTRPPHRTRQRRWRWRWRWPDRRHPPGALPSRRGLAPAAVGGARPGALDAGRGSARADPVRRAADPTADPGGLP